MRITKYAFVFCFVMDMTSAFSQSDSAALTFIDTTILTNAVQPFSSNGATAESEMEEQDQSSLLQSSKDAFVQFSVFQFAAGNYRMRGYPLENSQVFFNQSNVTNLETGYAVWNQWGGLNDVTRFAEYRFGNVSNRYGFSGAGGYVNIDSRASSFRKGTRISYSYGNRLFRNRLMVTHSTGVMANGWALTLSASGRYGNEVYVPGTYYSSSAFYCSIDKKLNDKNSINLTALTVSTERGRSSAEPQEVFELAGNNQYNSLWGYQNGEVRNSSVISSNRPILQLSHNYKINTASQINSSLLYTFGKSGFTSLNWNDAPNPRPDYYRNLPSYFYSLGNSLGGDLKKEEWSSHINTRQVDWDRMIAMNQNNLYTLPGTSSQSINTNETRARYILEDRMENLKNLTFTSVYNGRFKNNFLSVGFNANIYKNRKYKVLQDLLGASYWLDYDQFADNLGLDQDYKQNNIEDPDRKVYQGEEFGYNYQLNINRAELWSQVEHNFKKMDVYGGMTLSAASVWREGFMANGKFPDNSKGKSETLHFLNYGLKGGLTYKISGRHFITANACYLTRPPEANCIFISPRSRNNRVSDLQNEKVLSTELSYQIKYPTLRIRINAYYTQVNNQTWLRSYWADNYNNNVNLVMKNLDQNYSGIEFGLEKTFFAQHVFQVAFGYGRFIYTDRPTLEAWQDNNNSQLYSNRSAYIKNYYIGGMPQAVMGCGYRYNALAHWYVGISFNYFTRNFVDINPDRRTEEALSKYLSNEQDLYQPIIQQQQLPNYFILNAQAGKSFRLIKKQSLNFNIVVYNLLNDKNNMVSGFEQLRWDVSNIKRFDTKYSYMPGMTFMFSAAYTFN